MLDKLKTDWLPLPITGALAVWILTMLSLPLVGWFLGHEALLRGMSVGVLTQALVVFVILAYHSGWQSAIKTFLFVGILSFIAEYVGSHTGFPFGKYHYTDLLQPQIANVPVLIPLAWLMMLPAAWAVAASITGTQGRNWQFVLISALAFTAWDLFLDPQMVNWKFWVWETPGFYFGIPLSNYAGWILVSALLTFFANPQELPQKPLLIVYGMTWALQTIGQGIFWAQPGPALCGFVGAGFFIFLVYRRSRKNIV